MRVAAIMLPLGAAILLPVALLAGCGGSGGNDTTPVTSATALPVIPAPAGKAWVDVVTKTTDGYMQGNPQAPVKLVEYGSRTCPVCGNFANTATEPLREKYISTGRVSFEYREFWVHPQDAAPTLLGNCVADEAFFPVLDQMYAKQTELNAKAEQVYAQVNGLPQPARPLAWAEGLGYLDFVKTLGVPEPKARQCLSDPAMLKTFTDRIEKAAADKGVSGTPTFFINDKQVPNTVSWEQLEPALKAAGAR